MMTIAATSPSLMSYHLKGFPTLCDIWQCVEVCWQQPLKSKVPFAGDMYLHSRTRSSYPDMPTDRALYLFLWQDTLKLFHYFIQSGALPCWCGFEFCFFLFVSFGVFFARILKRIHDCDRKRTVPIKASREHCICL